MNFEVHGSNSINYDNIGPQEIKPEVEAPLAKAEFTYKEASKPPDTSTSITGPALRLFATFLTLGFSEDIHKKIKKTLVATLSKALTTSPSKDDRQGWIDNFKKDEHYNSATSLSVKIGEKATLDGMLIKPHPEGESGKYVIWLNGLGGSYESKLNQAGEYADTAHANILVFNYRGCGDSTSNGPTKPKDLVTDTMAMIAFLTDKGIKPEDIVIHGYSLGGGVGVAAAQASGTSHINDRSFSTFSKAIKEYVSTKSKAKVGEKAANVIGSLTASVIKGYDLDLNTGKVYQAGIKDTLILHHPDDKMIKKSSLKSFLEKHEVTSENTQKSNHKFVDLSIGSAKVADDLHTAFFRDFKGTAEQVAEFIHNKPFGSIHLAPNLSNTGEFSEGQFADFGDLGELDLNFDGPNFIQKDKGPIRANSNSAGNSGDFDLENLGGDMSDFSNFIQKPEKPKTSEEI